MRKWILGVLCLSAATGLAIVDPATPFTDHVVLQRERPVRIWGRADVGEKVTVRFAGQSVSTTADGKGNWRVELAPMPASSESRTLVFEGSSTPSPVTVKDVLVGEVWMCSGQSNADCPIWGPLPRYRDAQGIIYLQRTHCPLVRILKTPLKWSTTPCLDYKARWQKMTPEMLKAYKEKTERMPSAMGYYFALELFQALGFPSPSSTAASAARASTPGRRGADSRRGRTSRTCSITRSIRMTSRTGARSSPSIRSSASISSPACCGTA